MKLKMQFGSTSRRIIVAFRDSSSSAGAYLTGVTAAKLTASYNREDDGNAGATVISLGAGTRGSWITGVDSVSGWVRSTISTEPEASPSRRPATWLVSVLDIYLLLGWRGGVLACVRVLAVWLARRFRSAPGGCAGCAPRASGACCGSGG